MTTAILLKNVAIWLKTSAVPSVATMTTTGASHSAVQMTAIEHRPARVRPGVGRDCVAEQTVVGAGGRSPPPCGLRALNAAQPARAPKNPTSPAPSTMSGNGTSKK